MSKSFPEDWEIEKLDGKIEVLSGQPLKSELFCDDPSYVGVVRIRDLLNQEVKTFYKGGRDSSYLVQKGDILVGMDGDFNIVEWKSKEGLLNQRVCKVIPSQGSLVDKYFLFYSLANDLEKIQSETGATTVKHLSVKDIKNIEKALPPLPEQQKIATILSSVDDVIEKTRDQIDKLKDLKTGIMQELLTQGIGHTEFKDSPVGRIPASWTVVSLSTLSNVSSSKRILYSEYVESGVPFFRSKEVILRSKGLEVGKTYYISRKRFDEISRRFGAPKCGDILITAVGTIGVVYLVEDREFYFKDGNLLWLKDIDPSVSSEFLTKIMQSEAFQSKIDLVIGGSSQSALTIEKLGQLPVPLPSETEQIKIVKTLSSIDKKSNLAKKKLASLERLKKALMQDLLTGKVRVNIDQKESEVA